MPVPKRGVKICPNNWSSGSLLLVDLPYTESRDALDIDVKGHETAKPHKEVKNPRQIYKPISAEHSESMICKSKCSKIWNVWNVNVALQVANSLWIAVRTPVRKTCHLKMSVGYVYRTHMRQKCVWCPTYIHTSSPLYWVASSAAWPVASRIG